MNNSGRTPSAEAMSQAVLLLFRVTGRLLTGGDRLVAPLGLTSARWQVLGTIVAAERPQPVAWVARDMGAHRQNVQRIVNDLAREGFVALAPNPHHRKAPLVLLTDKGAQAYQQAMALQAPWMNRLTTGVALQDISALQRVLQGLAAQLEAESGTPLPRT